MDNYWLTKVRSGATFILAVLYLLSVIFNLWWLDYLIGFFLLIVLSLSLVTVTGASRLIGLGLFAVGGIILVLYQAEAVVWYQGIQRNLYLLAMFTLVPLLGAPIRQGGYMETLRTFFRRFIRRDNHFYLLIKSFTLFIAVMINVGVIPLMHQIGLASDKSNNSSLVAKALSRGFSASIIWAPSYAAVALVLELTGARWLDLFPYGLGLGLLAILSGWLLTWLEDRKSTGKVIQDLALEVVNWRKLFELSFFGSILIAVIVIISQRTGITTVTVVSMIALVFPTLWLLSIGRLNTLPGDINNTYFGINLPKMKNEVVLFLGAGFLATAIDVSPFTQVAPVLLGKVVGNSSVLLSGVIMLVILILSIAGIHPIISVTVAGSILQTGLFQATPAFLAVILTTSWALGVAVSPSSATNVTVASLVDRTVLEVSRWNWGYTIIMMVLSLLVINIFHGLGLL